ncbi:MAG: hypothetical protein AB1352_05100 [Patescibacteria group bacterium]
MDFPFFHKSSSLSHTIPLPPEDNTLVSPEMGQMDIHIMPEKFLVVKSQAHWLKKRLLVGGGIIVVLGGGMGLAAWLFLKTITPPSVPTSSTLPREGTVPESRPFSTPPPTSPSTSTPLRQNETPPLPIPVATTSPLVATTTLPISPTPPQTPPPQPEPPTSLLPAPNFQVIPPSEDSDNDKLTNVEEALWGTDAGKPDSDMDSFLDGDELLLLYDPGKGGGSRLAQSPQVRSYLNPQLKYTLLVPSSWENRLLDPTSALQVLFNSATGEFIGVMAQENFEGYATAREWYVSQYPSVKKEDLKDVRTETLTGIVSPDGLAAYFIDGGYLYVISYNPGIREEVNFQTTYRMVVQSFRTYQEPEFPTDE